ncbi:hypothetical protein Nepgr_026015 [Nepenthes gracilis]|uniref:Uncharacterized protein n=1 Tax=Nepenthes gracilis TaxID=150966 RepID=A0AAD3T7I4_NEPGR|nr:hypothetical protein Nepgr_026015 [Nepenthes gracilis]
MEAARSPAFSPCSPQVGSDAHCSGSLRPSSPAVLDSVLASVYTQSASFGESAHSDSLPSTVEVNPNFAPIAGSTGNEEARSHSAILASPVGVKPPVSVSGLLDDLGVGLADAVLGPKEASTADIGGSTGPIEFSDGAHHVLDSSSCSLDQFDGSLVGVPSINVNDTSREAHQPSLSTDLASEQEPLGWNDFHVAAASAVPPADSIIGVEMCLDYGQLLMDSVYLKNLSGFAVVGQWLRGVFYCCAAVRQFVANRDVVDCRRGGIVQVPRSCKEGGLDAIW